MVLLFEKVGKYSRLFAMEEGLRLRYDCDPWPLKRVSLKEPCFAGKSKFNAYVRFAGLKFINEKANGK